MRLGAGSVADHRAGPQLCAVKRGNWLRCAAHGPATDVLKAMAETRTDNRLTHG